MCDGKGDIYIDYRNRLCPKCDGEGTLVCLEKTNLTTSSTESKNILTHDDEIYLMGFYLRSNMKKIITALNTETIDLQNLKLLVVEYIQSEFDIMPHLASPFADEIIKLWAGAGIV